MSIKSVHTDRRREREQESDTRIETTINISRCCINFQTQMRKQVLASAASAAHNKTFVKCKNPIFN